MQRDLHFMSQDPTRISHSLAGSISIHTYPSIPVFVVVQLVDFRLHTIFNLCG